MFEFASTPSITAGKKYKQIIDNNENPILVESLICDNEVFCQFSTNLYPFCGVGESIEASDTAIHSDCSSSDDDYDEALYGSKMQDDGKNGIINQLSAISYKEGMENTACRELGSNLFLENGKIRTDCGYIGKQIGLHAYECYKCEKIFPYPSYLKKHYVCHTRNKKRIISTGQKKLQLLAKYPRKIRRPLTSFQLTEIQKKELHNEPIDLGYGKVYGRNTWKCFACDDVQRYHSWMKRHVRRDHMSEITDDLLLKAVSETGITLNYEVLLERQKHEMPFSSTNDNVVHKGHVDNSSDIENKLDTDEYADEMIEPNIEEISTEQSQSCNLHKRKFRQNVRTPEKLNQYKEIMSHELEIECDLHKNGKIMNTKKMVSATGSSNLTCSKCLRSFTYRSRFEHHKCLNRPIIPRPRKAVVALPISTHKCRICQKRFATKHKLRRHEYRQHGLSARNLSSEHQKKVLHDSGRGHICQGCGHIFTQKIDMQRHLMFLCKGTKDFTYLPDSNENKVVASQNLLQDNLPDANPEILKKEIIFTDSPYSLLPGQYHPVVTKREVPDEEYNDTCTSKEGFDDMTLNSKFPQPQKADKCLELGHFGKKNSSSAQQKAQAILRTVQSSQRKHKQAALNAKATISNHRLAYSTKYKFECDKCCKKYTNRSNLLRHKREAHSNSLSHVCRSCQHSFSSSSKLMKHIALRHK